MHLLRSYWHPLIAKCGGWAHWAWGWEPQAQRLQLCQQCNLHALHDHDERHPVCECSAVHDCNPCLFQSCKIHHAAACGSVTSCGSATSMIVGVAMAQIIIDCHYVLNAHLDAPDDCITLKLIIPVGWLVSAFHSLIPKSLVSLHRESSWRPLLKLTPEWTVCTTQVIAILMNIVLLAAEHLQEQK